MNLVRKLVRRDIKKVFSKDGKVLSDHIRIDDVIYVSTKTKGLSECMECDCAYTSNGCRLGSLLCEIPYGNCYKVKDKSKKVKDKGTYEIKGKRYYAMNGHCKECSFYNPHGCWLKGLSCQGHIPLKEIKKGGV